MEEKVQTQKEISELRHELERTHQAKSEALISREKNAIERLQKQQEVKFQLFFLNLVQNDSMSWLNCSVIFERSTFTSFLDYNFVPRKYSLTNCPIFVPGTAAKSFSTIKCTWLANLIWAPIRPDHNFFLLRHLWFLWRGIMLCVFKDKKMYFF